jgi:hypothetical protein
VIMWLKTTNCQLITWKKANKGVAGSARYVHKLWHIQLLTVQCTAYRARMFVSAACKTNYSITDPVILLGEGVCDKCGRVEQVKQDCAHWVASVMDAEDEVRKSKNGCWPTIVHRHSLGWSRK